MSQENITKPWWIRAQLAALIRSWNLPARKSWAVQVHILTRKPVKSLQQSNAKHFLELQLVWSVRFPPAEQHAIKQQWEFQMNNKSCWRQNRNNAECPLFGLDPVNRGANQSKGGGRGRGQPDVYHRWQAWLIVFANPVLVGFCRSTSSKVHTTGWWDY